MQVEAFRADDEMALAHGRREVWVKALSHDGDFDRAQRQVQKLPPEVGAQLPDWAARLRSCFSVAAYSDFFADDHDEHPEHEFTHEDWWIFRADDLEG